MSDGANDSDGETGVVRAGYDWADISPSTAVVETLAVAMDRDPATMEPLYDRIDPDALDVLVRSDGRVPPRTSVTVSFEVEGYEVTVHATGEVVVRKPD